MASIGGGTNCEDCEPVLSLSLSLTHSFIIWLMGSPELKLERLPILGQKKVRFWMQKPTLWIFWLKIFTLGSTCLSQIRTGSQSSHLVSPPATNLVVVTEARVMQDTKLPAFWWVMLGWFFFCYFILGWLGHVGLVLFLLFYNRLASDLKR